MDYQVLSSWTKQVCRHLILGKPTQLTISQQTPKVLCSHMWSFQDVPLAQDYGATVRVTV